MPPPDLRDATARGRVLVTGGSGFIGRALIPLLVEADLDVVNLDLRPGPGRWVRGDVRRPPVDLAPATAVVHLAGLADDRTDPSERTLHDVNVGGTVAMLAHARRSGAQRMVIVSSIAALGPSEVPLDERAPLRPTTAYGRSKAVAEAAARAAAARDDGPEVCIVRPGYVFGHGHTGNFGQMVDAVARRRFVIPGRPDTLKAGIGLADLAELLAHLATAPTVPPVVHAVYPDTPTIWWLCRMLSDVAAPPAVRVVPEPVARAGIAALGVLGTGVPAARRLDAKVRKLRESSNVVSRELGRSLPAPRRDWVTALAEAAPGTAPVSGDRG